MSDASVRAVCAIRDGFFAAHARAHPEDASTLGLREHAGRLCDPSREAALVELTRLRVTLDEVAAVDRRALDGEGHGEGRRDAGGEARLEARREARLGARLDARLDLDAVERVARHHVRWLERDADARNLELALLPNGAVQYGLLHVAGEEDAEAVAQRTEAVPEFLAKHAENLRRGARDGRAPDRDVVAAFLERVLPGAASSMAAVRAGVESRAARAGRELSPSLVARLATAGSAAAEAYGAFADVVRTEIAPVARTSVILGEAESAFRLRETMGLDASIDELVALGERALAKAHEDLVEHVRAWGAGSGDAKAADVKAVADAREALFAVLAPKCTTVGEAVALYRRHLDAGTRFVEERALVPVPAELALALEPLPDGIADGAALTNWPAPLLDPRGKGHALYSVDASAHAVVQAKNLAVHEGIPGHYLQSACWQRGRPSPVRFLGVTDDVAFSRSYFGAMLSVEGWAVHMEQLLLAEGFYEAGPERIFFAFCDAIRAMRVLLDLGLHARGMDEEEAVRMVMRATLMPEGWARSQVLRSKRIPLQSLTYLVGSTEIAALRARGGRDVDALTFHRALLDAGPVPPSRLGSAFG